MAVSRGPAPPDAVRRRINRARAASGVGVAAVCWLWMGSAGMVFGQSITAPAAQSITHDGTDAPQAFSEVVWQLTSGSDAAGYTAQWSCGPFQHGLKTSLKADTKLQIRVLSSGGLANWTATVPSDQTDYAGGDQSATVAAQSLATGDGQVGLTVTFVDNDFSQLGAGNYTITVTGTITAN